ncbi:hypothetical protein LU290_03240 [Moraxella nasibovis]|uniref:hypothetical protein n=1 Tax=Moraxella nasibovis TaxID=2904120 RepID=UPI00241078CE|nr:hypothetical protein [Moraxella nasibovis]WFF39250.1 hypothetical protein LU290_03240 [Moraxella nasibovis]
MRINLTPQEALQALADGKNLEYRWYNQSDWRPFYSLSNGVSVEAILRGHFVFRPVQEMITVGDVSFPKPVSEPPKRGSEYYMPAVGRDVFYIPVSWDDDQVDRFRLKRGLIHLSKENAIAHAKALIKLGGGKVDD